MASPITNPNQKPQDAGHVPITEEFDSFKRNMPAAGPVVIGIVLVALALGLAAYFLRYTPVATGSIDQAFAINVPSQNIVLAALQMTIKNETKKPIFLKNVKITVRTDKGEFSDDFASVSDFERYFQALPELRQHSTAGLVRETRIAPGAQISGTVIVSFPMNKDSFDRRQATTATVSFYDQKPIEIKK